MPQFLEKSILFYNRYPHLVDTVTGISLRMDVIARIYDNMSLFMCVGDSGCILFDDIARALMYYEGAQNLVLIHFEDLGLWGVFGHRQYLDFICNIRKVSKGGANGSNGIIVNMRQVVLADSAQKLVFMCTGGCLREVCEYAKDCFGAEVSLSADEITVAVRVQNTGMIDGIDALCQHMRGDAKCGGVKINAGNKCEDVKSKCEDVKSKCERAIRYIPAVRLGRYVYREYSCNDVLGARTIEELFARYRNYVSSDLMAGVMSTDTRASEDMSNDKITEKWIMNSVDADTSEDDDDKIAEKWIVNNLPMVREWVPDYYSRYVLAVGRGIAIDVFNERVSAQGYAIVYSERGRYWM